MSKKLLEESTIRQFMKLAKLEPLASDFLEEGRGMKRMEEEEMREELSDEEKKKVAAAADKAAAPIEKGMKGTGKPVKEQMTDLDVDVEGLDLDSDMGDEMDLDTLDEMMGELYEEDEMEMEVEEGDMEAEINITPDQARAIIAVADMLKDIMPDLQAPEAEEEMDMEDEEEVEEPEEVEAEEEEEVETPEGDEEVEAGEEELAEEIMKRVQNRLREMKNK
jgi:hypothetical protein